MALTDNPTWQVSLTYADRDRNTSKIGFHLPAALTFAQAGAAMSTVTSLIEPLTDAVLVAQSLVLGQYESTWPATPAPESSDVERYADFSFIGAVKPARTTIRIPSILNTLVIDGTNTVNIADAAVAAFIAGFIDTGLGVGNSPVTNSGVDLVSLGATPEKKHRFSAKG